MLTFWINCDPTSQCKPYQLCLSDGRRWWFGFINEAEMFALDLGALPDVDYGS